MGGTKLKSLSKKSNSKYVGYYNSEYYISKLDMEVIIFEKTKYLIKVNDSAEGEFNS